MKKITKLSLLMLAMLVSTSFLWAQTSSGKIDIEQQTLLMQKDAALGPMTYSTDGVLAIGDLCTDPYSYGNINDPAQNGSIVSLGEQWYSYTGPVDMTVTASLCGSGYDTKIEVWYACTDGTYAFYNDDACGTASEVTGIPFIGGSTNYVKVYGYSTASGSYTLNITGVAPPPSVTSYPYMETFTGTTLPNGWTNLGPDMWKFSGTAYYGANVDHTSGSTGNYAWVDDSSPYTNPSDLDAIVFDLTSITSPLMQPTLSFWYWIGTNGNPGSTLEIDIYDGSAWTYAVESYGYSGEWLEASIDLSPYSSAGTMIRFRGIENTAGFNCDICLDDVGVRGLSIGDLDGFVYNCDGLPMPSATVGIPALGLSTATDATGYYQLFSVEGGLQDVTAWKDGYNVTTVTVDVIAGSLTSQDFVLTKPLLTINPLFFDETLNPNEYLTTYLGILNTGCGEGYWEAVINYTSKAPGASTAIEVTGQTYPATTSTGNEVAAIARDGGEPFIPSGSRDLFACNADALWG
ncbi:MAG: hypothetical protein HQ521_03285, partial [Bacteroidetes bacterium]|nr:hypothetical protein [Bacteroidota bacterium]